MLGLSGSLSTAKRLKLQVLYVLTATAAVNDDFFTNGAYRLRVQFLAKVVDNLLCRYIAIVKD